MTAASVTPKDFLQDDTIAALVARTEAKLYASLRVMLSDDDAREVTQEAYLRVFLANRRATIDDLDGYTFRVARNLSISVLRKTTVARDYLASQTSLIGSISSQDELLRQAIDEERSQSLLEAINTLPPICQRVFRMRKLQGLSHAEIAEAMEISKKTIENHLVKGMRLVRERLVQATQKDEITRKDCAQ